MHFFHAAIAATALAAAAGAQSVTLEPTKDNTLFQNGSGALSSGAGDAMYVGRTGSNNNNLFKRGVLAFDVAGNVPSGATVTGVSLQVTVVQSVSGPQATDMHRLTQDWGEAGSVSFGGAGAPAQAGDATWIHTFAPGSTWSSPGGDFSPTVSATQGLGGAGVYTFSSTSQLVADVQDMLDNPAGNFGWILIGNEAISFTAKRVGSRESGTPSERPQLTITYTAASGPVNYCTAGTSASGCQATLSATGTPSATAPTGFFLNASSVEGQKSGLFFFGTNGRQANPWGNGTSLQCVTPPVARAGLLGLSGTVGLCDGSFSQDLNARWTAKPAQNPGAGTVTQAQLWYRDPLNTSNQTTSLSDAIEFTVAP